MIFSKAVVLRFIPRLHACTEYTVVLAIVNKIPTDVAHSVYVLVTLTPPGCVVLVGVRSRALPPFSTVDSHKLLWQRGASSRLLAFPACI